MVHRCHLRVHLVDYVGQTMPATSEREQWCGWMGYALIFFASSYVFTFQHVIVEKSKTRRT